MQERENLAEKLSSFSQRFSLRSRNNMFFLSLFVQEVAYACEISSSLTSMALVLLHNALITTPEPLPIPSILVALASLSIIIKIQASEASIENILKTFSTKIAGKNCPSICLDHLITAEHLVIHSKVFDFIYSYPSSFDIISFIGDRMSLEKERIAELKAILADLYLLPQSALMNAVKLTAVAFSIQLYIKEGIVNAKWSSFFEFSADELDGTWRNCVQDLARLENLCHRPYSRWKLSVRSKFISACNFSFTEKKFITPRAMRCIPTNRPCSTASLSPVSMIIQGHTFFAKKKLCDNDRLLLSEGEALFSSDE